jgi:transcriptional regulator with XRE-family HTH domain
MTSADYRATLAALGLTQVGAAKLLGVAPRTSRRWARDKEAPPPVARFLTYLVRAEVSAERVTAVLEEGGDR